MIQKLIEFILALFRRKPEPKLPELTSESSFEDAPTDETLKAQPTWPGVEDEPSPEEPMTTPTLPEPTRKDWRIDNGKPTWYYGLPDVAILHYSAGYSVAGCVKALSGRGLSVHASIERDGVLYPHREWGERAIHVGYGVWRGKQDLNQRAFGVEVINLGWMEGRGDGSGDPKARKYGKYGPASDELEQGDNAFYRVESWKDSGGNKQYTRVITKTDCAAFTDHRDNQEGRLWSEYTEAQRDATLWLVWDWISWTASQNNGEPTIPIENVVGHEHVRNGGKTDPGPGFFWAELYDYLEARAREELPVLLDPTWNTKARIAAVQSHVRRLGVDVGGIDGVWGKNTAAGAEKALQLFSPVYGLGSPEVAPENALELCRAFVRIPGFDRGAADHGGISDDLSGPPIT